MSRFKSIIASTVVLLTSFTASILADCYQSSEIGLGWRRDDVRWRVNHLTESHVPADVTSNLRFTDINFYTAYAKAKWADSEYYVRLSAEYGTSYKGEAHEFFLIDTPYLGGKAYTNVKDRIKRRSEVYDFNGAVGYPFTFWECRGYIVPLIGFSFHRQHLRVKTKEEDSFSSSFSLSSSNPFFSTSSPSYYDYSSSSDEFNPFSSSSEPIASLFGWSPETRTSTYRFTWYSPFLGFDLAYALDSCWTLFAELEGNFLGHCHRKRKSRTGVDFVDEHHRKTFAYGFNGTFGTTFGVNDCWYSTLAVDFRWWESLEHRRRDRVEWKSVGVNMSIGYMF